MAGYYNPKKDYAAAIKAEKNPAKQAQLKAERQNKIDAMNAAGTNTKGYTNSIYGSSSTIAGSLLHNNELLRQSVTQIIGEYKLRISHE